VRVHKRGRMRAYTVLLLKERRTIRPIRTYD